MSSQIALQVPIGALESPYHYSFSPNPMSYVVASAIKDFLKKKGMMTAGDFPEAASKALEMMLDKAAVRAKDNGRVTVRPHDL